jgi:flagellar L-ring protein FlgH
LVLGTGAVFGQLPGLPAGAPAASGAAAGANGTGAGARPAEMRAAAAVAPTGPVRGSLFKAGVAAPMPAGYVPADGEVRGAGVSFIAVASPKPKRYQKNDVLTVVIREDSNAQIDGQGMSKKTQDFDLALQQFLQMGISSSGVPTVGTVGNPSSLPEIKFKFNNDRQNDASQTRTDSFSARISALVVDVKPNGTMVIEAVKQILIDREVQVFKLSGVCRVEDVGVDNSILSTQLANLTLSKQTTGEVRDGTRSGWLNQWLDKWNPF